MFTSIRYVFGRVVDHEKLPAILTRDKKTGLRNISHSKRQDITACSYTKTCDHYAVVPKLDVLTHYRERDQHAWTYTSNTMIDYRDIREALKEANAITKRMVAETKQKFHPRNTMHCQMCDWKVYCRNDTTGTIEDWFGVRDATDYSGIIRKLEVEGLPPSRTPNPERAFITSPSGLSAFMQCPRKWVFGYHMGKEVVRPEWSTISARFRGTMAHAGVEAILRELGIDNDVPTNIAPHVPGDRDVIYYNIASAAIEKRMATEVHPELTLEARERITNETTQTAVRMYREAVKDLAEIMHIEQRFLFKLPGTHRYMTCQPDLVARTHDNRLAIIDFKTTSSSNLPNRAREFESRITMPLYAYAVKYGYRLKENKDGTEAS